MSMIQSTVSAIRAVNLKKTVPIVTGTLDILKGISVEIKLGESLAIVGASGSGKSTLLGILAGLDSPSDGQIHLLDNNITDMSETQRAEVRGQHVGFVFQSFHLLPSLTALENVMLPNEIKANPNARALAVQLLDKVGLGERLTHYPKQLSGGEQQRVALARAFASEPSILFADEPTGNLDTDTGQQIIELLFNLNKTQGTTLVLVTHDLELAQRCDRTLQLHAGQWLDSEDSHSAFYHLKETVTR